jgi:CRISPR-associated protein Csb1
MSAAFPGQDKLVDAPRILIEAELEPIQGDRFQPTGFADIGAARYQRPDGTWMLLVESAQSMANRLETTIVQSTGEIVDELAGMPYVRAKLAGQSDATTTSLIEAHRINSPFIISNQAFKREFSARTGYKKGKSIDWAKVASAIFALDPNSLVHGTFMANYEDGRIKIPRVLSAFIEAENVREAVSGGVKNNALDPTGSIRAKDYAVKDVYSNVPFHRVEYTAERITAFFNIDLRQIRAFGLGQAAQEFLIGLCLLKVRRFLEGGTRLRTACDLNLVGTPTIKAPEGFELPNGGTLLELVQQSMKQCKELFAEPPVTDLNVETVIKESKSKSNDA